MNPLEIIDKYYPADSPARGILITHSQNVAREALQIAKAKAIDIPEEDIYNAAMLHDIGIFLTAAPGIQCFGSLPDIAHGYAGADLLRKEGVPEKYARVAERHTGSGLSSEDIENQHLPLPSGRSYMPETTLEKLICFADCFWSKTRPDQRKDLDRVRQSIKKFGEGAISRFDGLAAEFL